MLKIGLTGGIGSGKSTVCQLFQELGIPIIDADVIARQLTQPGQAAISHIADQFGTDVIDDNGELKRDILRQRIFSDAGQRKKLETILHPLIKHEIIDLTAKAQAPYIIIAIPLLIESHWQDMVDRVLVIDTSVEQQILRSKKRDNVSETQIRSIIQSQVERKTRCQAADDIIHNDSDLARLKQQVLQQHQYYLGLSTV